MLRVLFLALLVSGCSAASADGPEKKHASEAKAKQNSEWPFAKCDRSRLVDSYAVMDACALEDLNNAENRLEELLKSYLTEIRKADEGHQQGCKAGAEPCVPEPEEKVFVASQDAWKELH